MRNKYFHLVNGTSIRIERDYDYAVFIPERHQIVVKKTNNPPQKGFVIKREDSTGVVIIPKRLRIAYGIDNTVMKHELDKETLIIEAKCIASSIPSPLGGLCFHHDTSIDWENLEAQGEAELNSAHRIYCSNILPIEWRFRKVTVHAGECLRIEVEDASSPGARKNYPSAEELREEFGQRMQWFAGKSLAFVYEVQNNTDYANIPVPKFFRTMTNMKPHDVYRWYKLKRRGKDVYIFAPKPVTCEFDDAEINPAEEIPQKVTLCEECADQTTEIGRLMQEIAEVRGLMEQVVDKFQVCKEENLLLKEKLQQVGQIIGGGLSDDNI